MNLHIRDPTKGECWTGWRGWKRRRRRVRGNGDEVRGRTGITSPKRRHPLDDSTLDIPIDRACPPPPFPPPATASLQTSPRQRRVASQKCYYPTKHQRSLPVMNNVNVNGRMERVVGELQTICNRRTSTTKSNVIISNLNHPS